MSVKKVDSVLKIHASVSPGVEPACHASCHFKNLQRHEKTEDISGRTGTREVAQKKRHYMTAIFSWFASRKGISESVSELLVQLWDFFFFFVMSQD